MDSLYPGLAFMKSVKRSSPEVLSLKSVEQPCGGGLIRMPFARGNIEAEYTLVTKAFLEEASRVPDLYEGRWDGKPLGPSDYVLSADEKTGIQARIRKHPTLGPRPQEPSGRRT